MAANGKKNGDDALILALAGGLSVPKAAARAEVSERTARRRLADPAFRAKVDEARAAMVRRAVGKLARVGALAGHTLGQLVRSESDTVRLGACRAVLDFMFRGHEVETLARQVEELMRRVEELHHDRGNAETGSGPAGADPDQGEPPDGGPGGQPPGPAGPGVDGGGPDAGPLAGGPATIPISEDVTPLFPASG